MSADQRDEDTQDLDEGVVAPGAARLAAFFRLFASMPHRGSGTYLEARSARLLAESVERESSATDETESFAVDLSSGAFSVALHGVVLTLSTLLLWVAGLASAATRGAGPLPMRLGILGSVPAAFAWAILALALGLAAWASRPL